MMPVRDPASALVERRKHNLKLCLSEINFRSHKLNLRMHNQIFPTSSRRSITVESSLGMLIKFAISACSGKISFTPDNEKADTDCMHSMKGDDTVWV